LVAGGSGFFTGAASTSSSPVPGSGAAAPAHATEKIQDISNARCKERRTGTARAGDVDMAIMDNKWLEATPNAD
jgi:hypothetical protein